MKDHYVEKELEFSKFDFTDWKCHSLKNYQLSFINSREFTNTRMFRNSVSALLPKVLEMALKSVPANWLKRQSVFSTSGLIRK